MPDEETPAVAEEETPSKSKANSKATKSTEEQGVSYDEWISLARPAFGVRRAMVAGALYKAHEADKRKKYYTRSEVVEALKAFGAEVKKK